MRIGRDRLSFPLPGTRTPLVATLLLAAEASLACAPARTPAAGEPAPPVISIGAPVVGADSVERAAGAVRPGVEVLAERVPDVVRGRRVGLVTNHTGVDRAGRSTIEVVGALPDVRLVALFGPEHGIRGTAAAGEKVESGRDARTGLPVHSLYGGTQKPTPEMLEGVEALVFDIQDIGARPYTYVYTMALSMRAAAERGIPFVVLDRPNPIGGTIVEGNLLDTAFASFVGMYRIPMRHGMTAGELARLFNARFGIGAALTVVRAEGWTRGIWYDGTGLPWTPPSPNIPRLETAIHYPGTVLFEGTNLSEGRGTDHPFEQIGAPWLDAADVAATLNALALPGVRAEPTTVTPRAGTRKYADTTLHAVRLTILDRDRYRPVETAVRLLEVIRRRHPDRLTLSPFLDRLAGTDELRLALERGTVDALLTRWRADAARFEADRREVLLY
jgi:uncharacterized protein YbbC (DUF1343 family)